MEICAKTRSISTKFSNKIGDSGKIGIMDDYLSFVKTAYVETKNLMPILQGIANPYDWISRKVKSGELIRLKNSLFLIKKKIEGEQIPYEQVANILYGPSYISLEWALSHYGMIPEGVYVVTSVTTGRSRSFTTSLGTFDYHYLSHNRYSIGIDQQANFAGNYLIASPEKALADTIHFKSRNLNETDLLNDLIEGRRIEIETLRNLNKSHLAEIAEAYHSPSVRTLVNILGRI